MIDFDNTPPTEDANDDTLSSEDAESEAEDDDSDTYSADPANEESDAARTARTLRNTAARQERAERRAARNEARNQDQTENNQPQEETDPNELLAEAETTIHEEDERPVEDAPRNESSGQEENNQIVNEQEEEDVNHITVSEQSTKLKTTKWREGLSRNPKIGGVHMGKIPLSVETFQTEDMRECIRVSPSRNDYMIQSGQMYIPFFKRALKKSMIENLKEIGTLPAMVSNIFLPTVLFENIIQTNKKNLNDLIDLISQIAENYIAESAMLHQEMARVREKQVGSPVSGMLDWKRYAFRVQRGQKASKLA